MNNRINASVVIVLVLIVLTAMTPLFGHAAYAIKLALTVALPLTLSMIWYRPLKRVVRAYRK